MLFFMLTVSRVLHYNWGCSRHVATFVVYRIQMKPMILPSKTSRPSVRSTIRLCTLLKFRNDMTLRIRPTTRRPRHFLAERAQCATVLGFKRQWCARTGGKELRSWLVSLRGTLYQAPGVVDGRQSLTELAADNNAIKLACTTS